MKYTIALLLALSASASAEMTHQEICTAYSSLAGKIMTLRQMGEEMAITYVASDTDHYRKLVVEAYEEPRYGSKPYQNKTITKFQNKAFLQCIKSQ